MMFYKNLHIMQVSAVGLQEVVWCQSFPGFNIGMIIAMDHNEGKQFSVHILL